jgi:hypothetical protein
VGAASRRLPRCWNSHAKCPRLLMFKRAAIQAEGMVVLERNSRANRTFPGSTLRRALRSASVQRIRLRAASLVDCQKGSKLQEPCSCLRW